MELSKKHLDAGFFCTDTKTDRHFWGNEILLEFQGTLELGEDIVACPTIQYRYIAGGSIVKVNAYEGELPNTKREPSGYSGLFVAGDVQAPKSFNLLSGETIISVPNGHLGIVGIGVNVTSNNPERLVEFYTDVMQFKKIGDREVAAGETLIFVKEGEGGTNTSTFAGTGFRYLTLHVTDADSALQEINDRGGKISMEPIDYGSIARLGFVTDPDGNWIEVAHVNR